MTTKFSLHVRIMGIAVIVLVMVLATAYYVYVLGIEDRQADERIAWKMRYIGRIVSNVIQQFLVSRDFESSKAELSALLATDNELASLRVRLQEGDAFYLLSREDAIQPERYFERTEWLVIRGRTMAQMVVGFWRRDERAASSNISILNLIIVGDLMVLVALFLHLLLHELVTRPLEEFVDATKRVSGGDFSELSPITSSSREEERLRDSFNDMITRLRESREELSRMNAELEQRVTLRTQEVSEAHQFSQTVIASVADGLYTVDANKILRTFNPAAEKLTGLSARDVIGKCCYEVLRYPFCRANCILERLPRGESANRSVPPEEYLEELEVGGRTWLVAGAVFAKSEKFGGGVETIKDLSYTRRLQQRIRQVERLTSLGILSAGIAHEINNPLSNIKVYAQLMDEEMQTRRIAIEDALGASLRNIIEQTDRASTIVRKMLDFSRRSQTMTTLVDIPDTIKESAEMVQYLLTNSGIEVLMEMASDLPQVPGDRLGLQQVFVNLFNNARQAMKDGGTLTVKAWCEPTPGRLVVTISDTGHGISPGDLTRIFDPFFTTKEVGEGTGLGLSISYGIIKDHGGEISAESQPGQGTTFTISLPCGNGGKEGA